MVPLITLEEHFVSRSLNESEEASLLGLEYFPSQVKRRLLDLTTERIQEMDAAGIAVQIVSHNPAAGTLSPSMCQAANNQLFNEGISSHPTRLAGLAALPMSDPAAATEELTRCVTTLNFKGALISNHAAGKYFDDPTYWPVFERAQHLNVPIYLHPTFPTRDQAASYAGNYTAAEQQALSAYAWGWHSDTGSHFLRLFASGLFDELPRLKLILGHEGEMLPYMIERIARFAAMWPAKQRDVMTVWRENVWVTTSGMFTLAPLACVLRTVGVDRILFSIDYPFEDNREGKRFMEEVAVSGLVTEHELEMIAYKNAETLLGVSVEK